MSDNKPRAVAQSRPRTLLAGIRPLLTVNKVALQNVLLKTMESLNMSKKTL